MSEFCRKRRRRLSAALPKNSVALIPAARLQLRNGDVHHPFRQSSDFYYLTDFLEPDALLVLGAGDKGEILFCSPKDPDRERWDGPISGPEAAAELLGVECLPLDAIGQHLSGWLDGAGTLLWSDSTPGARERIAEFLTKASVVPGAQLNLDAFLHRMRLYKDQEEIGRMQKAAEITTAAHRRMMARVHPGMIEYQLEAEGAYEFARGGACGVAYSSIVGGGANACILHYVRNDCPLQDGDLVLIDAGCEYRGYAADITRTFPVSGTFSAEQRAVYEVVLRCQQAVIEELAPGVPYARAQEVAVYEITRGLVELGLLSGRPDRLIEAQAYRPFYMHRVGHWLGMDVHDVGGYETADGQSLPLEEGMVMTVEPGIYMDGNSGVPAAWQNIGIRIEDDVLITASGAEVIGASPPSAVGEVEALTGSSARA